MVNSKYVTWRGKLLGDYSKEELIEIIIHLNNKFSNNITEHKRQLEFLVSLGK